MEHRHTMRLLVCLFCGYVCQACHESSPGAVSTSEAETTRDRRDAGRSSGSEPSESGVSESQRPVGGDAAPADERRAVGHRRLDAGDASAADAADKRADAGPSASRDPRERPEAGLEVSSAPSERGCKRRSKPADVGVHFHHVHMNSTSPDADMAFYERFFDAPALEYCRSEDGSAVTLATQTDRGWFLYDRVNEPPDDRLNSYLEHIGWIHPDPAGELQRLVEAGAPLFPVGRGQCESAFMGTMPCNNYWFYLQAPNGARIEDALGPGPATMGFGHVHFVMGVDFDWLGVATDGAIHDQVADMVNHTDVAIEESNLAMEQVVDSRGKSIDHLGYSVPDLDLQRERVLAAGLAIAEDISWKPAFGFRSFFLRSPKGVWIELLEDEAFVP